MVAPLNTCILSAVAAGIVSLLVEIKVFTKRRIWGGSVVE